MHTKPRIAFILGGLPFGGIENWLFDLLRYLDQQEDAPFETTVVNISGTGVMLERYREAGLPVVNICDSTDALNTHRMDTVLKVRKAIQDIAPDIVHTLQFSGDYFGRLATIGMRVPVVTHIRNIKRERVRRRFFNKLLRPRTDLYLAVSKQAVETIRREHGAAGKSIQVLYNAVDPNKLDVAPHDLEEMYGLKGPVVLGVGRLVRQKNFDMLIRAFALLQGRYPEAGLVIVGDGSQRNELQSLITESGLDGRAFLAGYRTDVPRFLRAAHILAMPSDYEGLPVTHVEALFCGLPAVISDQVPSIEIAPRSSLVCDRTPENVAEKLDLLLGDDDLRKDMGNAALEEAREHSMDRYVLKLASIYRELLARKQGP